MRLARLELLGFKSFADPTVLDFGHRSLTGVVGPNGCGKSNVVDAVRWALGETRPTSMRGSGMTDVIFKGSASRPAMGFAEVTLVFDNTGGVLPERGAEVSVTRRLESSGEGEYLIDGQRVRLKDVKDLLFDTGLGSRGYAVLEQGRIDAVLSANPQQRRAIFEEAAGISRYRQRRHETELRLKHVAADMERAEDVIRELQSRVRSLKIQAGKAERWIEARGEWVTQRRRHLGHRLFNLDGELGQLRPRIDEQQSVLEELRGRRAEHDAEAERREAQRGEVVAELDRVSGESGRLEGDARALAERARALLTRVENWEQSAEEEDQRAGQLGAELEAQRERAAQLAEDTARLLAEAEAAGATVQALTEKGRALGRTYQESRARAARQNDEVLERLRERGEAGSRVRQLEEEAPRLEQRVQRLEARGGELGAALTESRARTASAREALAASESEQDAALAARDAARVTHEEAQASLRGLERRRGELELERAGLDARVEALRDRERQLEELSDGTRRLMEAVEGGEGPCSADALLGVIADHIAIDTRLSRALDTVFGDRAAAIVARDAHVARRVLEWARQEEVGELSIAVPPGLGAPPCPSPTDYALFARYGNGVEGRLSDLVACAPAFRPLARALLCDVVVVSNLDLALKLVGDNPQWRFVTPVGELVDAGGLSGGHREIGQGAVGRRAQADELEARSADLSRALDRLADEQRQADEAAAAAAAALGNAEAARDAAVAARSTSARELAEVEGRLTEQETALREQEAEVERAREEHARVAAEIGSAQEAEAAANAAFEAENQRLSALEQERRELEAQRDEALKEASAADVERQRLASEHRAAEESVRSERARIERDEEEVGRARSRAENFRRNAAQGREEAAQVERDRAEREAAAAALAEELEALRQREREGAAHAQEARREAEAVQAELDRVGEAQGQDRMRVQRLELEREELLVRADEELQLSAMDLKEGFEPEPELADGGALRALGQRVAELKGVLDKLGPVNLEAVHELDEVSGRLEHLETQSKDLAEARRNLEETIRKIDEESRRLFLETFTEVREHFRRIFRQLFGGGKADLEMEADRDVLEAGIEILAKPPGRETLPIGLLSGGQRTMTALALLFAVFQSRPSPFCILDEVDAALDDANVDRFLAMLDSFRETSQFVVVTHNKGTMSACEALFGVTMQTKGVSRFVSVELSEVDEFAPESTGKAKESGPSLLGEGRLADPDAVDEHGEPVVELRPQPRPEKAGPAEAEGADEPESAPPAESAAAEA
jgi:chromosome segregation protein